MSRTTRSQKNEMDEQKITEWMDELVVKIASLCRSVDTMRAEIDALQFQVQKQNEQLQRDVDALKTKLGEGNESK